MSARAGAVMACVLSSCGGEAVDALDPVTLVLDGEWSDSTSQTIVNAAQAWNLEFGLRLEVGENGPQKVPIRLEEGGCFNDFKKPTLGRALPDDPLIKLCTKLEDDIPLLFETVRHELGHILGIRVHAGDDQAVMARRTIGGAHWFRKVDRYLFQRHNPRYFEESGCDVTPVVAYGASPAFVQPTGRPLHLAWADELGIHVAPFSPGIGVNGPEAVQVLPEGTVGELAAHTVPVGLLLTWMSGNELHSAMTPVLDGRTVEVAAKVPLEWPQESFYGISKIFVEPYVYLAVTVREGPGNGSRDLHLFQIDPASGAIEGRTMVSRAYGELVMSGEGELLLVTAELEVSHTSNVVRIRRVDTGADTFGLSAPSLLTQVSTALIGGRYLPEPVLSVRSARSGILMLVDASQVDDAVTVMRVGTGAEMRVERQILISAQRIAETTLLDAGDHVFLAASMIRGEDYEPELYLAQLDPQTLAIQQTWERFSSADSVSADRPLIAIAEGHVVAAWEEAGSDVRSRCIPLP